MFLDDLTFAGIIAATPLVSIDLIVRNKHDEVLLGKRANRPALGRWFVPGGRIHKGERARDALERIARNELGINVPKGRLIGVFDHFYEDNVFGTLAVGTHYVALGYEFKLADGVSLAKDAQHSNVQWWSVQSLLASEKVHANTKLYFSENFKNGML